MAEVEIAILDGIALRSVIGLFVFAGHRRGKTFGDRGQRDAAFGTFRSGHRGHHVGEIERQGLGEYRIGRFG